MKEVLITEIVHLKPAVYHECYASDVRNLVFPTSDRESMGIEQRHTHMPWMLGEPCCVVLRHGQSPVCFGTETSRIALDILRARNVVRLRWPKPRQHDLLPGCSHTLSLKTLSKHRNHIIETFRLHARKDRIRF